MTTLQARLETLASAIGTDVKGLRNAIGILSNLTTDAKNNLVFAINELEANANYIDAKIGGSLDDISAAVGAAGPINLVQALQKLYLESGQSGSSIINDEAGVGDFSHTFSADKILSTLAALESKILGGIAPETLDTIKELADYLTEDGIAGGLVAQLSKKVDASIAQSFTALEKQQARENIGAASDNEFQAFLIEVGSLEADFLGFYEAAKL